MVVKTRAGTSVAEFYNGKFVLITGATGFLGAVLLETLLRCCPGIESVLLLLREKKGVNPKDRMAELFKRSLFDALRAKDPGVFRKVRPISGDLRAPGMGLSQEDGCRITESVSIVFHAAASTSFSKPLKYLMLHNVLGSNGVLELCKKLKHCEALVYTSTAYSNCNRRGKIEEKVYALPHHTDKFINATTAGDDGELKQLVSECKPDWPSAYAFSKCAAENLLAENGFSLPVAIIRPSLIAHVWRGVLPGYAEEESKFTKFLMGLAKGFIKVVQASASVDFIPVDVVANTHVLAAWALATKRHPSPFVANCTSYGSYTYRMADVSHAVTSMSLRNPPPHFFRYTDFCWIVEREMTRKFLSVFVHYIPALALDLYLFLIREKLRVSLVSMYRYLDRKLEASRFLLCNSWTYETENFKSLRLTAQDEETFYTDLDKLDLDGFVRKLEIGAPSYDWKTDSMPKFDRLKRARRTFYFTQSVQGMVAFLSCCIIYAVFSQMKNLFWCQ